MRTVLLALLLALPAAAQGSITAVNGIPVPLADPELIIESTIGTQLTIEGTGFFGLVEGSKPVVWIHSAELPKKRVLKVLSSTDTEIVAEIKVAKPGDFDLTVKPKGKGLPLLVAEDVVRIVPPAFEAPVPSAAAPGGEVTLTGLDGTGTFGTKPGKVRVSGKKAPLVSWLPDTIVFRMPAKLANGLYVVEVTNKVATATVDKTLASEPWCLQMVDSPFDLGGPDRFKCKLNAKTYKVSGSIFSLLGVYTPVPVPNVLVTAQLTFGPPSRTCQVMVPVDLELDSFPKLIKASADGLIQVQDCEDFLCIDGSTWTTDHDPPDADDYVIVLHGWEPNAETGGTQLHGTFSGTLLRTEGTAPPAVYELTKGDFKVTVDP